MNGDYAELDNIGVFEQNCEQLSAGNYGANTLIVLGAPRGGTSAIAGALAAMGIYMGRGAAAPVFESLALANAIESGDQDKVRELIDTFNQEYPVWGFKRPGFTRFVDEYHALFRNPIYLVIFRDPAATASRSIISGRLKVNYLKKLRRVLTVYEGIVNFVEASGAPTLFISYEKLLQDPLNTLTRINDALKLETAAELLNKGARFVEPSPEQYLEASRSHRVEGEWLELTATHVKGWARYASKTMNVPPRVVLYDGDQPVMAVSADMANTGPSSLHNSAHDNCRFEFDLKSLGIYDSTGLRVRVQGDIRDFATPALSRTAAAPTLLASLLSKLKPSR
ncbi:MAG: hypothetical protein ACJAYC_002453 [Halieaceae bacterium]|jgi:hypothetical protein